jgi:hypothetical protein
MERSVQLPAPKHGGMMTPNGAHRALSANKQFSTRSCVRCEGLLVSERSYDLQNPDNHMAETLRCVQCGTRIDAVILQNQIRLAGERQSKQPIQHAYSTRIVLLGHAA